MIISFDLDDTLFVNPEITDTEKPLRFPFNLIYRDRIRLGTVELLSEINNIGIGLWIYTTSFRSERYIKSLFRHYGIKIDNVVNGERHQKEVQGIKKEAMPSKYPSKYRIDLHVDDDISVAQNGKIYGFRVYLIDSGDSCWVGSIRQEIRRIQSSRTQNQK